MAFTEDDRVDIRLYMGASALFVQNWPALENAITSMQSVADGGQRPNSSSENLIRSLIVELKDIDQKRKDLRGLHMVSRADEANIDGPRGMLALAMEGRPLVHRLARTLGMRAPLVDVFSSAPPFPSDGYSARIP